MTSPHGDLAEALAPFVTPVPNLPGWGPATDYARRILADPAVVAALDAIKAEAWQWGHGTCDWCTDDVDDGDLLPACLNPYRPVSDR